MNLSDLIDAVADARVTPRFVRFLISEGVIPAPTGGRTYATYGDAHLAGIERYLRLRDTGLSVGAIKLLLAGEAPEVVALDLAPGLILSVRPADLRGPLDAHKLAQRIADVVADLSPSGAHAAKPRQDGPCS